jgi:hypothetical protein
MEIKCLQSTEFKENKVILRYFKRFFQVSCTRQGYTKGC